MNIIRDFGGYLLGLAFCVLAFLLCFMAWTGLEVMFGWQWALGGVVLAVLIRVNLPVLVGLYFYATTILGWQQPDAVLFALPGLLIVMPSVAVEVFELLVHTTARR